MRQQGQGDRRPTRNSSRGLGLAFLWHMHRYPGLVCILKSPGFFSFFSIGISTQARAAGTLSSKLPKDAGPLQRTHTPRFTSTCDARRTVIQPLSDRNELMQWRKHGEGGSIYTEILRLPEKHSKPGAPAPPVNTYRSAPQERKPVPTSMNAYSNLMCKTE